jgi:ring-1,2-phenylacetyl-CoA epoxidase subunit PaaE
MAKFYKLKVSDVVKETADSVSIAFQIPEELKEEYKYIHGQYVTLKMNFNGEELRRSYSICSSPVLDKELRIAIKKVKGGRGSNWLNENAKPGVTIEVMTPMGNFYSVLNPTNKKKYVLFAGGSGVTPMLSILKTILHVEPQSSIVMFYGNQDEPSIIFKKQLDQLMEKNPERLNIYHILDNPGTAGTDELFKGIMNPEKIKLLITHFADLTKTDEYFICGPGGMMESVRKTLEDLKVDKNKIHIEYFTATLDEAKTAKPGSAGPKITSDVTVIMDGEETSMQLDSDDKAILDAALEAGVDVPFACKGAVCCTCRAKLMEGKVHMDNNFALSEQEVKEGYILTCQSHPLTPKVVVSYDEP